MTIRIAMWSGPRNISTAMMRSWESRPDTEVVDEPFYAYYLNRTRSPHPCFDEVVLSQSRDYAEVAKQLSQAPSKTKIQYQKHMTHHMLQGEELSWTKDLKHCFLIRDPRQVVHSYTNSRGVCSADDIGIVRQVELYEQISDISGQNIPIIDSNDVLRNPRGVLSQLCERLGVSFDQAMLDWPRGSRDSDGIWAKHWYHSVEQSTGFAPYQQKTLLLNEEQEALCADLMPHYQKLFFMRLRA
ncbi:MAG: hypothetical protein ACI965_001941 [Paraglaciecola sp.]|jgi:hypothetical protein